MTPDRLRLAETAPRTSAQRFGERMVELLPRMIRGFARRESNYLSRGKITLPQLWILEHLSRRGSCPMNELARFLGISRPAATGLVDRLIGQELVSRLSDPKDRRVVRVNLTPKGRRVQANIWEQKRKMLVEVFGKLSPKDRSHYLATLEKVVRLLSEKQP
ncbi:MAG: MarR family transcriptional regulator [Candidatus Omnitrophica bacterium]|nr:MarR family transcriptional regulator [Candidatus Omnitrophota bacterium]